MAGDPANHDHQHDQAHDTSTANLEAALMSLTRGLRRGWAQSIAHTGIAPHQARALRVIAADGPIRPGALADRLHVAARSVTEVVDALVDRGLVLREPDPADRRAMTLTLTGPGRELVEEITAIRRAHTEAVFGAALSAQEQQTLGALLARLTARLAP